jgi:hypothetical protein
MAQTTTTSLPTIQTIMPQSLSSCTSRKDSILLIKFRLGKITRTEYELSISQSSTNTTNNDDYKPDELTTGVYELNFIDSNENILKSYIGSSKHLGLTGSFRPIQSVKERQKQLKKEFPNIFRQISHCILSNVLLIPNDSNEVLLEQGYMNTKTHDIKKDSKYLNKKNAKKNTSKIKQLSANKLSEAKEFTRCYPDYITDIKDRFNKEELLTRKKYSNLPQRRSTRIRNESNQSSTTRTLGNCKSTGRPCKNCSKNKGCRYAGKNIPGHW